MNSLLHNLEPTPAGVGMMIAGAVVWAALVAYVVVAMMYHIGTGRRR